MDDILLNQLPVDSQDELLSLAKSLGLKRKKFFLPSIVRVERSQHLPVSFAQQRLWFLAQLEGASQTYHSMLRLRLKGKLDSLALRRALDRILARHEVLRATFASVDGEPVQQINPVGSSDFLLTEHDLRHSSDQQSELEHLLGADLRTPFNLEQGPLVRGQLLRLSEDEQALLINMHHIVSDGWSIGVLVDELSALYNAFALRKEDPLPELGLQYVDYAVWHRQWVESMTQEQAEYWKDALEGVPVLLELPADRVRPAQQDYRGAFAGLTLNQELTTSLQALSQRHGTTLFMTLLAGWAALLMRLSGQQDLVIGAPVANRQRAEIEGLIGFFVNTLALRLNVSGSLTVRELLNQAKAQTLAAQQHQDIPFEQVVEIVQPPRSLAHSPLFQVMFAWEGAAASWPKMHGLEVTPLPTPSTAMTGFDLTLALRNEEDSIVGGIEYATSLFERTTIERYIGCFQKLLEAMAADENQMIGRLPLLGEGEYRQLVYGWNETAREFPRTKGVHELFEEQAEKNGEAPAVVYDDQQLSYGELNRRANRLAHYLRELGVGPDERVGICVKRSVEMFVAALGVLKAGGAYVPLDPEYPAERLRFMLEDSEPKVVLTRGYLCGVVKELGGRVPIVDLGKEVEGERPETNLQRVALKPEHLAYLIYTSGSTGQPKGVMIEHRAWCNLISQRVADLKVDRSSRASQFVSFSFDAWGEEVMTALCGGATLYVVGSTGGLQVEALSKIVTRHAITHVFLPPTILSGLQEQGGWESAGTLVVGGSRLSGESARRWGRGRRLINEYGPTEATVSATLYECRGDETNDPPIGRPIGNARIYILDPYREPVPVGVVGEIYIGGMGVARGYWKRPELTAERFMKDPFSPDRDGRMYKTGDLGRWLAGGNIEFLGRNDHQVKIRGFRIELDEIKARLVEHAGVREAAVIAREGATGDKRLVAYYTQTETSVGSVTELRADELRDHLSAQLPEYMVPAAYVRMNALPLTANGKLDRQALPEPEWDAYAVREYEAPVGEVEGVLAETWSELLGVEQVGRWDNFFELGGHSMLAVQVIAQVRERLGLEMDLRALFEAPTLATLAAAVSPQANVLNVPPNRIAKVEQTADESVNDIEISI